MLFWPWCWISIFEISVIHCTFRNLWYISFLFFLSKKNRSTCVCLLQKPTYFWNIRYESPNLSCSFGKSSVFQTALGNPYISLFQPLPSIGLTTGDYHPPGDNQIYIIALQCSFDLFPGKVDLLLDCFPIGLRSNNCPCYFLNQNEFLHTAFSAKNHLVS